MKCPNCKSPSIIRKGRRKTRFGFRQPYHCKECRREFTDSKLLHKTYGPKVISSAISYYNLGNTLQESAKLINRRFKVKVSKSSVSQWLKEYKDICTYHKIRPAVVKDYQKEILVSRTFTHSDLAYTFKYHRPKLDLFCVNAAFLSLKKYIMNLENVGCPQFFDGIENRCLRRAM
jgi:transposase-like protein